ncbi:MAG: sulfate permease [Salinivirgaceae bacterium]|nr:sulfate permease [Salinivirgaceae bacterium]MDD4746341.1 sulfate permease [Salinivirgaceae bacterium]
MAERYFRAITIFWRTHIPALTWLRTYNRTFLGKDTIAGITLAAYAIPVSLAYASLAGLPPQYGIYGYLLGGFFYALIGSSRQLAIGPTSAISLLVGVTISGMANGDPQRWVDIASFTALVFAGMSIFAYFLRLNGIINFISDTVMLGFKAGAALAIATTQLPKLFGVAGGGQSFFTRLVTLVQQWPQFNYYVLGFGAVVLILLILGDKFFPGRPIAILLVVASILVVSYTPLGDIGFSTVGVIPAGLPKFHVPTLYAGDIDEILMLAFACFLLAYIESVSSAKAMAQKYGYKINPRQELLALGIVNLATAFGQSYPVSGGLSQTAVNEKAGAQTPVALIVASIAIGVCLVLFAGLLENLPNVVLACIVIEAVKGLIDVKEFVHLWKTNKTELVLALIAVIGVLVFGILEGVLIATFVTLVLVIKAVSTPHVAILGRIPGTQRYSDVVRNPDNELFSPLLLFRVESSVYYFNTEYIENLILLKVDYANPALKTVIWDLNTSPQVDRAGAKMIGQLHLDLKAKGVLLRIANARAGVRDILRNENIDHLIGKISRKVSLNDIVDEELGLWNKS